MQYATFTQIENADRNGFEMRFVGLNIPASLAHEHTTSNTPWQPHSVACPISEEMAEEINDLLSDEDDERIVVLNGGEVSIESY